MRMLRPVCGNTLRDRINNEILCEMIWVALTEDKMRENRLGLKRRN